MAKLKMPLLSIGATGKIAKAIVFFGWKGLDVAREYVIPSNPRTPAQTAQRSKMSTAVATWHSIAWTAADLTGWTLWASIATKVMTGFNSFVLVGGGTWAPLWDGRNSPNLPADRGLIVAGAAGLANATVRYGLKPRVMLNTGALIWDSVQLQWEFDIPAATYVTGDRVYFQFYEGATFATATGITGIYYFDMP